MPGRRSFVPLLPFLLLMVAGVFALDLITPLGVADGMLYVVPVMAAIWLPGRRMILATAAVTSLLVLGGALWSHPGAVLWVVALNRLFSLIVIWAVAVLALQRNRLLLAKEQAYQDAERRVQERTDALTEALEREWREEESRDDARKQLTGFLDVTLDAVITADEQQRIIVFNHGAERAFGYTAGEVIGKQLDVLFVQELQTLHRELFAKFAASQALSMPMATRTLVGCRRKNASTFPCECTISKLAVQSGVYFTCVLRDITDRVKADQALREREEQYRTVVENATDGVVVIAGGRYVYANNALLGMYGIQMEQLLDAEIGDFIIPEQREEVRQRVQARLRGEPVPQLNEYTIRRPDGAVRTLQGAAGAITFGNKPAAMLVVRDVTEARRMQSDLLESNRRLQRALEDLHRAQQQLVRQERLSALGKMASGIVHDFNNALTPIVGFTEMMLDNPSLLNDKEKASAFLRQCNASANAAHAIVSRLRDFYRPREQSETFSPVDVNEVVRQATSLTEFSWKLHAIATGRAITVTQDLAPMPNIQGNATELTQALVNLILNAVDAMPRGGEITLCTRPLLDGVLLTVRDTGIGMSEEVKRHCLEPFFTTKGEHGTGLGLPVVYGVVQRHSGSIDIESELGKGAAFRIRLPAG